MNFATIRAIVILSLGGIGAGAAFFNLDFLDQFGTPTPGPSPCGHRKPEDLGGPRSPVPGTVPANSRELGPQLPNGDGYASVTVGANAGNQIAMITAHRDVEMPAELNEGLVQRRGALRHALCSLSRYRWPGRRWRRAGCPAMTPPSLTGASAVGLTDGEIYAIIRVGRVRMPAYGGRITPDDRWRIVQHVRSLQQGS